MRKSRQTSAEERHVSQGSKESAREERNVPCKLTQRRVQIVWQWQYVSGIGIDAPGRTLEVSCAMESTCPHLNDPECPANRLRAAGGKQTLSIKKGPSGKFG
jgi:hypothetical protein